MRVYYEIWRAGNGYNAMAPFFPGYVAAAETVEEVRRLMLAGLPDHIRGLAEDGEPMPPEPEENGHINVDVDVPKLVAQD